MKKEGFPKIENAIADIAVGVLTDNYSESYTYEGFINETIEIYAFSKTKKDERYCILSAGVHNDFQQIYIPDIMMPPLLDHKGIGKKLIRLIYEIGQVYGYDVFVVQLTDNFKERLLKRGAITTDQFDTLQIIETTNLLEP